MKPGRRLDSGRGPLAGVRSERASGIRNRGFLRTAADPRGRGPLVPRPAISRNNVWPVVRGALTFFGLGAAPLRSHCPCKLGRGRLFKATLSGCLKKRV